MLLRNASVLLGQNLEYRQTINLKIQNGRFKRIQPNIRPSSKEESVDCEGILMIPGLVNCHTHVGDSIAKDVALNTNTVEETIHPVSSIKSNVLSKTEPDHLVRFMRNTCQDMIRRGITTFVDFREGGLEGILLVRKALKELGIRPIILARTNTFHNSKQIRQNQRPGKKTVSELEEIIPKCDGLGISGANENSVSLLRLYSKTDKIRAIHAAETRQSITTSKKITKKSEVIRALELKPHFLVHMTFASKSDLFLAARKTRGIVVCPRANAALVEGIPNVDLMLQAGCNVTIGTDNVMVNSPDIFREMDYLWKVMMGTNKKRVNPKQILKMATVNAKKLLHKNIGVIENGAFADAIFIDKHAINLEPMHNPYASIVHRVSESNIRGVMVNGRIVHGKI